MDNNMVLSPSHVGEQGTSAQRSLSLHDHTVPASEIRLGATRLWAMHPRTPALRTILWAICVGVDIEMLFFCKDNCGSRTDKDRLLREVSCAPFGFDFVRCGPTTPRILNLEPHVFELSWKCEGTVSTTRKRDSPNLMETFLHLHALFIHPLDESINVSRNERFRGQ